MKFCSMVVFASMALSAQAFAPSMYGSQQRPNSLNMVSVDTSEIKTGMTIELDGEPHKILSFSIMKQAKAVARTTVSYWLLQ
jgi:elongation factor P